MLCHTDPFQKDVIVYCKRSLLFKQLCHCKLIDIKARSQIIERERTGIIVVDIRKDLVNNRIYMRHFFRSHIHKNVLIDQCHKFCNTGAVHHFFFKNFLIFIFVNRKHCLINLFIIIFIRNMKMKAFFLHRHLKWAEKRMLVKLE